MQNNSYQINRNAQSSLSLREIKQVFNDWVGKLLPIRIDLKHSQRGDQELESNHPETENADAVFLGWQKTPTGEVFPIYNVTAKNHPLYCSTVSDQTLRKQNLKIPQTPTSPKNMERFDDEKYQP